MSEINLTSDEQQKLEASQQLESLREKRKEYNRKFRERHPHYSKDYYLGQKTGKGYTIKPNSKKEWIRETVIDPSKRDNRVLIDVEKYDKKNIVNIIEIRENHYRDFIANHNLVNEHLKDISGMRKKNVNANKKLRKVAKTDKNNKVVENKAKKAVGHLTKSPGVYVTEFPVKSESDLGFYPQLPLLDLDLFKKFHFED